MTLPIFEVEPLGRLPPPSQANPALPSHLVDFGFCKHGARLQILQLMSLGFGCGTHVAKLRLLQLMGFGWTKLPDQEFATRNLEFGSDYDSCAGRIHDDPCSSQNCSSQNYDSTLGQTHFCPVGCLDAFLFCSGPWLPICC